MMEAYRKAALELHNLNKEDQIWMLQQFPETDRIQLKNLLQELKTLGIKRTGDVTKTLVPRDAESAAAPLSDDPALARAQEYVRNATSADITHVLVNEPDHLIAAVLSIHAWPWRAEFLNGCGVEKKLRIAKAIQSPLQLGKRMQREFIVLLSERLASLRIPLDVIAAPVPVQTKTVPSTLAWQYYWQRVVKWLR